MRAILLEEFGGPEVLQVAEVGLPEPGPGEVRVKVGATAVLRTRDVATRSGNHPFSKMITPPHVLGGEFGGTVDAIGPATETSFEPGTRVAVSSIFACGECAACRAGREEACPKLGVLGIQRAGSYADYAIAPAANLFPIPEDLSFADAAVLGATGPVARAQIEAAGVQDGSWVAIPGAAGALGSMNAALALSRGAKVVGLERAGVGHDELIDILGVQSMISTDEVDDLTAAIREATDGYGIDAVVDNLAIPPIWSACLGALAPLGRIVMSGAVGGGKLEFDPVPFYLSSQSIIGVRTGNRSQTAAFWEEVADGFRLPEELITTFPLDQAHEAHRRLESGDGKVGHFALQVA